MTKTVILIDDDAEDLHILKIAIERYDPSFHCISFLFPDEALNVITDQLRTLPDYIFIDVNMTGRSGTECLKILRNATALDEVPIVMYSISMPEAVGNAFKKLGATFAFQKPSNENRYGEILETVFEPAYHAHITV